MASNQKSVVLPAEAGVRESVIGFLKQALEKKCVDDVLLPAKMPGSDAFTYLLIQDEKLLQDAYVVPPIMPTQGAKAIQGLKKMGESKRKVAAVLRPCEVRAAVELFKLGQVDLENMALISIDCPGALPLAQWADDPKGVEEEFLKLSMQGTDDCLRTICKICDKFSSTGSEDLHVGTLGVKDGTIVLISNSAKGNDLLECVGLSPDSDSSGWIEAVNKLTKKKAEKRQDLHKVLEEEKTGLDKLVDVFSSCINCHNCMRVCPICYCQQCLFDSSSMKFRFDDYLERAENSGGLRLLADTTLFHLGRILHMSLSCVSCGACEDACPMSIPVAQLFSLTADRNQGEFDYVSGRKRDEPLPLRVFEEAEFEEVEQSYIDTKSAK